MAIAGLLVVCLLMAGCISVSVHQAVDDGKTKEEGYSKSEDTQESTDSINRLESKISGIDASQNDIKETVNKTSQIQQDMRHRDEVKDRLDPKIPREQRKILYKEK